MSCCCLMVFNLFLCVFLNNDKMVVKLVLQFSDDFFCCCMAEALLLTYYMSLTCPHLLLTCHKLWQTYKILFSGNPWQEWRDDFFTVEWHQSSSLPAFRDGQLFIWFQHLLLKYIYLVAKLWLACYWTATCVMWNPLNGLHAQNMWWFLRIVIALI